MFLNLTNKQKQSGLLVLAGLCFILGIYQATDSQASIQIFSNSFILAIAFAAYAWRYSNQFLAKHSFVNSIYRLDDLLVVKQQSIVNKRVKVDVKRISQVIIGDNYLSLILDGNGQGFDFQLVGTGASINRHIENILCAKERKSVALTLL